MPETPQPTFTRLTEADSSHINSLVTTVNDWAEKKGWNEYNGLGTVREQRMYKAEKIALMHTELSEAMEGVRSKEVSMDDKVPTLTTEAAEMADVMIRVLHYCGEMGIDLGEAMRLKHEFNISRPYRHGKAS